MIHDYCVLGIPQIQVDPNKESLATKYAKYGYSSDREIRQQLNFFKIETSQKQGGAYRRGSDCGAFTENQLPLKVCEAYLSELESGRNPNMSLREYLDGGKSNKAQRLSDRLKSNADNKKNWNGQYKDNKQLLDIGTTKHNKQIKANRYKNDTHSKNYADFQNIRDEIDPVKRAQIIIIATLLITAFNWFNLPQDLFRPFTFIAGITVAIQFIGTAGIWFGYAGIFYQLAYTFKANHNDEASSAVMILVFIFQIIGIAQYIKSRK